MRKRSRIAAGSIAALALAASTVFAGTAVAKDSPPLTETQKDWGTIVPDFKGPQANAWVAKLQGATNMVDTALFETHYPGTPAAPKQKAGGKDLIEVKLPARGTGSGLGIGSGLYSRVVGDALPSSHGAPHVPLKGAAFASASAASITVGLPYVPNPRIRSIPLSPLGIHADGISVQAIGRPGKPLELNGRFGKAMLTSYGKKIIDIPADWPPNFGARIPQDRTQPALASALLNEQVTVDSNGEPTVDSTGHYAFDPKASSGYVNAGHATTLGLNAADLTIGHAAVLIRARG